MFDILLDPYNYPFWIMVCFIFVGIAYVMGRPFLTYVKFNYPNAKFEAMGNPFISEQQLSSILENKDIESFKESFQNNKDYDISGDDVFSIQQSLDDSFVSTLLMMKKDSSKSMKEFFDVYIQNLDSYIVKHAILNFLRDKKDRINPNDAHAEKTKLFLEKIRQVESDDISHLLKEYGISKDSISIIAKEFDQPLVLDSIFNKYIIQRLSVVSVPYKCEQIKQQFIKILLDCIHIRLLLRCKQLQVSEEFCKKIFISEGLEIAVWKFNELAELDNVTAIISSLEGTSFFRFLKDNIEQYNKEQSVQVFEVGLDKYFLDRMKDLSIQYYSSLGPTLRFLISKEFEIKNLKIIVKGIYEDVSKQYLKRLLVWEVKS
ncbi:MAG: V-type ATPase subunit [Thermoplasmatota archaeon]